ncbi:hypothetical protein ACLOJK_037894 [Asimina triloba]
MVSPSRSLLGQVVADESYALAQKRYSQSVAVATTLVEHWLVLLLPSEDEDCSINSCSSWTLISTLTTTFKLLLLLDADADVILGNKDEYLLPLKLPDAMWSEEEEEVGNLAHQSK